MGSQLAIGKKCSDFDSLLELSKVNFSNYKKTESDKPFSHLINV